MQGGTLPLANKLLSLYIMTNPQEEIMSYDPFLDDVQIDETEIEDYDVEEIMNSLDNYDDDAEVLASAGWGTDEDYGYFGGGDDW